MNNSTGLQNLAVVPMLIGLATVQVPSGTMTYSNQSFHKSNVQEVVRNIARTLPNLERSSQFTFNRDVKLTNVSLDTLLNNELFTILNHTSRFFSHCEVTLENYQDPEEDFNQIKVIIGGISEDQMDSYFSFVEFATEVASNDLNEKIFFSLAA